jgi:hypothetical protein
MTKGRSAPTPDPKLASLSGEERKSVTHGEFWIPEREREVYRIAMSALERAGVPFIVSGLYAIYEYTGIYRQTKDLDLFFEPGRVIEAARVLKSEGFELHLEESHWLAKAMHGDKQIDLIYGMGNGVALIDADWYRHSRPGILAGMPVRVSPPEDLIWHRLFVSERHRFDMSDVLHLILCRGDELDWDRLIERVHEHWRLLLAQIHFFDYAYPGHRGRVPQRVRDTLTQRAAEETPTDDRTICNGTLISRFSFSIDVNEWGFRNLREEAVAASKMLPVIQEIAASDVWTSRRAAEEEAEQA